MANVRLRTVDVVDTCQQLLGWESSGDHISRADSENMARTFCGARHWPANAYGRPAACHKSSPCRDDGSKLVDDPRREDSNEDGTDEQERKVPGLLSGVEGIAVDRVRVDVDVVP